MAVTGSKLNSFRDTLKRSDRSGAFPTPNLSAGRFCLTKSHPDGGSRGGGRDQMNRRRNHPPVPAQIRKAKLIDIAYVSDLRSEEHQRQAEADRVPDDERSHRDQEAPRIPSGLVVDEKVLRIAEGRQASDDRRRSTSIAARALSQVTRPLRRNAAAAAAAASSTICSRANRPRVAIMQRPSECTGGRGGFPDEVSDCCCNDASDCHAPGSA